MMTGLIPFDADREISRSDLQPGARYRMAFSLDGQMFQVRNVVVVADADGALRVRWADESFQPYPPSNGADVGLLVDELVDGTRFERVDGRQFDVVLDFPTVDEINDALDAAAIDEADTVDWPAPTSQEIAATLHELGFDCDTLGTP